LKIKSIFIGVVVISLGAFLFFRKSPLKKPLPNGRETVLVCFGDSLTSGVGASEGKSYPDYLKNYLDVKIVNSGVPGDTTSQGKLRFQKDVMDYNPDVVIIELGANDYFSGFSSEKTGDNLRYMADELSGIGAILFIAKFFPEKSIVSFIKSKDKEEYDKMYKELVSRENVFLIENIWGKAWAKPKYMSDRVHPNELGYEIMAQQYFKAMEPLFKYNGLVK
jgi:lysophospholipase L1-like esterase